MKRLWPQQASELLQVAKPPLLIDVRESWELEIVKLPNCLHIPLQSLPAKLDELPTDRPLMMLCHHGVRSLHACQFLESRGFSDVINVEGGIDAWARSIDPDLPVYT